MLDVSGWLGRNVTIAAVELPSAETLSDHRNEGVVCPFERLVKFGCLVPYLLQIPHGHVWEVVVLCVVVAEGAYPVKERTSVHGGSGLTYFLSILFYRCIAWMIANKHRDGRMDG